MFSIFLKVKELNTKSLAHVQNMMQKSEIQNEELNNLGIKTFEQERYIKLERLGKGSFGEVWKARDMEKGLYVAMKYFKVFEDETMNSEDLIDNVGSFLRERAILERITALNSKLFTKYEGTFFIRDEATNKLLYLVLISTAGDCSLADLIKIRTKVNGSDAAYTETEAITVAVNLLEGMKILEENGIYHSDIKDGNFILNLDDEVYQVVDFGVSRLIPLETKIVEKEEYACAGTYISPEKERFWNSVKEDLEQDPNDTMFNPFKCDLWSMGHCLEKMIGTATPKSDGMKKLIERMKEPDWKLRADVNEAIAIANELGGVQNYKQLLLNEDKFVDMVEEKRRKKDEGGLKHVFEVYQKAYRPAESLEIVQDEYEIALKKNKGVIDNNLELFCDIILRLGNY